MAEAFTIRLNQVVPLPLKTTNPKSIWNREVSLTCGTFYQVLAPSGTGKSTLIGILNGIRKDFTGSIALDDENLSAATADRWVTVRGKYISTVFQDLRLFDNLTVLQNISLLSGFESSGLSPQHIHDWCARLQVEEKANTNVGQLSYGQRQRVAILRALHRDFRWLLLDEPFSHLDEANMQIAFDLITDQCRARKAGLIITGLDHRFSHREFQSVEI